MSWCNEQKDEWKEILQAVAAETNRTAQMVEKDVLQSIFLDKLSKTEIPFVFKGGTSLSKAYGLINRFSEDIDLSTSRPLTQAERKSTKKIIVSIGEEIGMVLNNPDNVYSNHDYNKYVFNYDSLFCTVPLEIIVETSYYLTALPYAKHKIHSIVGDFCSNNNISMPIRFDADLCEINVQTLERTFIDKIFAVCDYYIQDMRDRDSRHLYDICKMLPHIKLDETLKPLILEVRKDRLKLKNNPSAQPEYDITLLLSDIIGSRFYELDYRNITTKLLYEDLPYDDAVKNGIAIVKDAKLF